MPRVACYYRVSTREQTIENQREECQRVAKRMASGGEVVEFSDVASATKKGHESRPGLGLLLREVDSGRVERVVCAEVSRIARDVGEGAQLLKRLSRSGAPLYVVRGAHDTGTKHGMMGALYELVSAEVESTWLSERTRAGLARTKAKLGRPSVVSIVDRRTLVALRDAGSSWGEISRRTGLNVSTIRRAFAQVKNGRTKNRTARGNR